MTEDLSEQDADQMPTGIIDVAVLPDSMPQLDRKFYVNKNLVYWDSRLQNLGAAANAIPVNGFTTWVDQSIKMNDRTQGFFDDNTAYPYLYEGTWYEKLPTFADPQDLLSTQVDAARAFCLATVDTTSLDVLADWRIYGTDFLYADWPIPVNLSYSDADLKTGGTDGLPIGDLNWFPTEKATFNVNKVEYDNAILDALENGGSDVEVVGSCIPTNYTLAQNYPNPFNPTTSITFTIPKAGNVTLKVYDMLGKEVATLVNGYKTAQSYKVEFDGASLSSGVYLYTLSTDNFTQTKKMVLMK
jgi:hypothetical protein